MVGVYFEQNGYTNIINLRGGIDSWAKTVDNEMATY
jgi:rhodanese-related sulfurtransferase